VSLSPHLSLSFATNAMLMIYSMSLLKSNHRSAHAA
jgi:hypothetical protein